MAGDIDDAAELARLERAVARLPRRQRQVLLARRLDGLGYVEIAALTGLTPDDVERQLARALCNIDRELCGEELRWWQRRFGRR